MSISESGPCSQVNHGLWEEKRRSLVFVDKGSLFGGEIESNFCRGDFERSLSGGGPFSGGVSRSGLTVFCTTLWTRKSL